MALAALTGQVAANAAFQTTKSGGTGQSAISFNPALSASASFTAVGTTTAGTANITTPLTYTVAVSGGSATTIDLTSITDPLQGSVTFARLKAILIQHAAASTSSGVKWDTSISNSFTGWLTGATGTPIYTLLPGEQLFFGGATASGKTVDSTHKIITLTNLDAVNTATVYVFLVGADA